MEHMDSEYGGQLEGKKRIMKLWVKEGNNLPSIQTNKQLKVTWQINLLFWKNKSEESGEKFVCGLCEKSFWQKGSHVKS